MRLLPTSLLDRYVLRQLFLGLVVSTTGLVALMWLVQSLRFVDLVVNRGLSLWVFLNLTGLLVPQLVGFVLPVTCFVVVLAVYQRMAGDREITVMRGAGLSNFALSRPAIAIAVATTIFAAGLSNWLVPLSYGKFREAQFAIRNRMAAFLLQDGVFTQMSNGLVVYVRKRDNDGTLHGVLIDDSRTKGVEATIFAERGVIGNGLTGPRVVLQAGSRQQIDRKTGRLDVLNFDQDIIDLGSSQKAEDTRPRDPDELPMAVLLQPPAGTSQLVANKYIAEAHRRMAVPLSCLSYAMVALAAVLTGAFSRQGNFLRPTVASLAIVVALVAQLAAQNMAGRDTGLVPMIWVAAILPGVVGAFVLFKPAARPMLRRVLSARPRRA